MYPYTIFTVILAVQLLWISIFDIRHLRIPDLSNAILLASGFAAVAFLQHIDWIDALAGSLGGAALLLVVRTGFHRFRGYHGLGLGDVKLVGAMGSWSGLQAIPSLLFYGSICGILFIACFSVISGRQPNPTDRWPFGPFLCAGLAGYWLFGSLPELFV